MHNFFENFYEPNFKTQSSSFSVIKMFVLRV